LNQANKAKQSEAKTYVGSINKGHQAYYTENTEFTSDIAALGVGIETQTTNYQYTVAVNNTDNNDALTTGDAINDDVLNSYYGMVFLADTTSGGKTSRTILCETTSPGSDKALASGDEACGADLNSVGG